MSFTASVALILLTTFISASNAFTAPSALEVFRPVLSLSKLQCVVSPDISSTNLLNGYANWFFYLDGSNAMTFKMNGSSRRSELRQMATGGTAKAAWSVGTGHKLVSNIAIPTPPSAINEITLLQIHCSADVPALRISFVKSVEIDGTTYSNAIIATVRNGPSKSSPTEKSYLRSTHTDFVWYTLAVSSSKVNIWVGSIYKQIDLSVWNSYQCYFKAGAYINNPDNDSASGVTRFKALTWY